MRAKDKEASAKRWVREQLFVNYLSANDEERRGYEMFRRDSMREARREGRKVA